MPRSSLPPALAAEVAERENTLRALLDLAAGECRRFRPAEVTGLVAAKTLRERAAVLAANPALGSYLLAIRLVGARLHAIGGLDQLELSLAIVCTCPGGDQRHALLRCAWHQIGEHLA